MTTEFPPDTTMFPGNLVNESMPGNKATRKETAKETTTETTEYWRPSTRMMGYGGYHK